MQRTPVKYTGLVEYFEARIEAGELKGGDRLPSFAEIQEMFQVSPNTANRALMALEQAGLVVRERNRGTFVKGPSRRAAQGVIGLSGKGFSFSQQSTYWADLLGGIQQTAEKEKVQLMLLAHDNSDGWEKVDGLIVYDWAEEPLILPLVPPGMPCVSVLANIPGFSCVTSDDGAGMRIATEYLLSLGHRRIAYLYEEGQEVRRIGYQAALEAAGIVPDPQWTRKLGKWGGDKSQQFIAAGRNAMTAWLTEGWSELGCAALLAHNDQVALGAMDALTAAGFNVPDDVSVVGYDGTEIGEASAPPLSSVVVPLQEIGKIAVKMLLDRIEDETQAVEKVILPPRIHARASTASPSSRFAHL